MRDNLVRRRPSRAALLSLLALSWPLAAQGGGPKPEAASATKVVLPDGPGSVRGLGDEAEVGIFSAQVSYGVPFDLPAGRAGLTPSLGLTYAGELGNGSVGVGWRLAYAAVRRSTRHGVPSFSDADELELIGLGDDGRLVPIGDGQYRLEAAGNRLRIQREHNRFVVTDSDGVRYFLGLTPGSRQQDAEGRAVAWLPELVVHPSGAFIEYAYQHHQGQVYLERIAWGPGRRFEVLVDYDERLDPVVSYREGFRVRTELRLSRVRVRTAETELRAYHLTYDDALPLSRLAAVEMTGFEGQGALPTLQFGYAEPEPAAVQELTGTGGWHLEHRGVTFFDVDGDGVDDLIRLESGNHEYRKNLGGTFGPRTALEGATGLELSQVAFIDLSGDARPELVRIVNDEWRYSKLVDGRWESVGAWPGTRNLPLRGPRVAHADLDGDGRIDVLEAVTGGLRVTFGGAGGMEAAVYLPAISPGEPWIEPGVANVQIVDVNGDGLADAVWIGEAYMKVFLGRGDGTFAAHRKVFYPWPAQTVDARDLRLVDLNRDGIIDLVRFTAGHVLYFPGRTDGSLSWFPRHVARPEATSADVTVALSDANGNGSVDIVWSSPRGMWVLDLAGATSAGMLASIDNGLGRVTRLEYAASGQLAVAAEQAGDPWAQKLPVSIPVPVRARVDPGAGGPERVVHYGVRDGFWDGEERRFGGFLLARRSMAAAAAADVLFEETTFLAGLDDERVLRGRPTAVRTFNGLGALHTSAHTKWLAHPVDGLPSHPLLRVPVAKAVRTSHHEGVTTPIDTLVTFVHDGHGRVVEEHDEGRLDLEGDESVRLVTYADDDAQTWIRDRVCQERLEEKGGALVTLTRTYFGGPSGTVAPLCEVGAGLVRRVDGWLDDEERWIVQSETEYSALWNPTVVYEEGVTREFGYDQLDLHLETETVEPAQNETLTWTLDWDTVRGLPEKLTDPSGVVTWMSYDDLGRVASVGQGTDPAHTHHVYDWVAPRPTTTTYVFDGDEGDLDELPSPFVPGEGWRQTVAVANGAGEALFSATRLETARWIVEDWVERDRRGRAVLLADAFHWTGGDPRQATPPMGTAVQTLTYDAHDRIRERTLPTGAKQRVSYEAFFQRTESDDLAPVLSIFDGKARILRTERTIEDPDDPMSSTTESVDAIYDAAGRLRAMQLQNGAVEHSFEYDTLGRMTFATDPDIGDRHLLYDDRSLLIEHTNGGGQTVEYAYDAAGRLTVVEADDGSIFEYHYDTALDGNTYQFTAGRLAWVEEQTGKVQLGYDAYGRQVRFHRQIVDTVESVDISAEELHTFAPSGLLRQVDFQDGLVIDVEYDAAGRPVQLGDLWTVDEYDAAGRILGEEFGNGVTQTYVYDENGQPEEIAVFRPAGAGGAAIYDVSVTRNAYGAITAVTDDDEVGLDHTVTFAYDGAARLVDAVLGTGMDEYEFRYRYDGLQNMVERGVTGPTTLGAHLGEYVYGEARPGGGFFGPRQLTSIVDGMTPVAAIEYDLAGRQVVQNDLELTYNGLDQLILVEGLGGSGTDTVEHAYGYDGFRVLTRSTDSSVQYWFTPGVTERNGLREHYVRLGDRIIARVDQQETGGGGGGGGGMGAVIDGQRAARALALSIIALCLVLFGYCATRPRRLRARWAGALSALLVAGLVMPACGLIGRKQSPLWENAGILYFHHGIAAGPVLFTKEDGTVFEERRYEPFGDELDAYREVGGQGQFGSIDFVAESHNILNKQTDPNTGWSYHGARWMAPETARWLTPDPPVKAPAPKFMERPWALHPYQYVEQNPVRFWDPDGLDKSSVAMLHLRIIVHPDANVNMRALRQGATRAQKRFERVTKTRMRVTISRGTANDMRGPGGKAPNLGGRLGNDGKMRSPDPTNYMLILPHDKPEIVKQELEVALEMLGPDFVAGGFAHERALKKGVEKAVDGGGLVPVVGRAFGMLSDRIKGRIDYNSMVKYFDWAITHEGIAHPLGIRDASGVADGPNDNIMKNVLRGSPGTIFTRGDRREMRKEVLRRNEATD